MDWKAGGLVISKDIGDWKLGSIFLSFPGKYLQEKLFFWSTHLVRSRPDVVRHRKRLGFREKQLIIVSLSPVLISFAAGCRQSEKHFIFSLFFAVIQTGDTENNNKHGSFSSSPPSSVKKTGDSWLAEWMSTAGGHGPVFVSRSIGATIIRRRTVDFSKYCLSEYRRKIGAKSLDRWAAGGEFEKRTDGRGERQVRVTVGTGFKLFRRRWIKRLMKMGPEQIYKWNSATVRQQSPVFTKITRRQIKRERNSSRQIWEENKVTVRHLRLLEKSRSRVDY